MTTPLSEIEHRFDPVSLILGWLLPGLGYLWMGERKRGLLVMTGIGSLVIIGVLVGGVDVVDRQDDGLWFVPQVLLGPITFGLDWVNVTYVKSGIIGTQSIGRVNEIGTLYLALAGLLNLATLLDSATRARETALDPDKQRRRRNEPQFIERRGSERPDGGGTPTTDNRDIGRPPQLDSIDSANTTDVSDAAESDEPRETGPQP